MKNFHLLYCLLIVFLCLSACADKPKRLIEVDEVSPWCIIGFDSLERTPTQRIEMLQEMGFTKYGYNRGKGEFGEMKEEFKLAKENNIEIVSIFLWLNANRDSIGKLSPANQELLDNLKQVEQKPTIWVSFSNNYFEERTEEESVKLSIEMIKFVKKKADELGCKLALYNHHGWFGNPYNQVEILEKMQLDEISMVYNFHHAHEYVDEFPEIVKKIKPYLSFVNLNGVQKDGPQILPIGKGDHEIDMVEILIKEGFDGPWGILGHIKTDDVQAVLTRNVEGLNLLNSTIKN